MRIGILTWFDVLNYRSVFQALVTGIPAKYILMDTCFTNETIIKRILGCGLDVVGMLKNDKADVSLSRKAL